MAMAAREDWGWEADDESGNGSYIYFRRPDGSITASDIGKNNTQLHDRQNEGWVPLPQYGQFQWNGYAADHPYEVLLARGGAKEFTVAQLVEMGYHLDPDPIHRDGKPRYGPPFLPGCRKAAGEPGHGGSQKRTVHHPRCWARGSYPEFPQLAATPLERGATCAFCDDDAAGAALVYATRKARDQHVKVMHQEELRAARVGQELGAVLAQKLGQMGMQIPAFACNRCPQTFDDITALATHVATHDERADLVAQVTQAMAPPRRRAAKEPEGDE